MPVVRRCRQEQAVFETIRKTAHDARELAFISCRSRAPHDAPRPGSEASAPEIAKQVTQASNRPPPQIHAVHPFAHLRCQFARTATLNVTRFTAT